MVDILLAILELILLSMHEDCPAIDLVIMVHGNAIMRQYGFILALCSILMVQCCNTYMWNVLINIDCLDQNSWIHGLHILLYSLIFLLIVHVGFPANSFGLYGVVDQSFL